MYTIFFDQNILKLKKI